MFLRCIRSEPDLIDEKYDDEFYCSNLVKELKKVVLPMSLDYCLIPT